MGIGIGVTTLGMDVGIAVAASGRQAQKNTISLKTGLVLFSS